VPGTTLMNIYKMINPQQSTQVKIKLMSLN